MKTIRMPRESQLEDINMSNPMMEIYPVPEDLLQSRLVVEVRAKNGDWISAPVGFASSIDERPHANGGSEGWVCLSTDCPLDVKVTIPDPVAHAKLRPSMREMLSCKVHHHSVEFQVENPRYLVIEINHRPITEDCRWSGAYTLYLLIDPIDHNAPQAGDVGVRALAPGHHHPFAFDPESNHTILLLPGVHTVEEQMIDLHSDKTLYLMGGAYLRSYIKGEGVDRASICGRGVIDGTGITRKSTEWRDDGDAGFVFFRHGTGNLIDGPVIFDSPFWNIVTFGTTDTVIKNHKCITWKVNNDGIQPRSCNGMRVEHCFLKCADDCIAVKTRRGAGMISHDLSFRDLVCWNDVPGNAIEIGHTSQADILKNVSFEDIAVVHATGGKDAFVISISLIDHCHVHDISYKNFYIEGISNGDFRFWIGTSRYTTDQEQGQISQVIINGYHLEGDMTHSLIQGIDSEHSVQDIYLDNITCNNGKPASGTQACFTITHADNISFNGKNITHICD